MISVSLILVLLLQVGPDSTADDAFAGGVMALEEGRTMDAYAAFDGLVRTGRESGAVYLNLGLAAAALDRPGEARWAMTRAQRYGATRADATAHLREIDRNLNVRSDAPRRTYSGGLWLLGVVLMAGTSLAAFFRPRYRPTILIGAVIMVAAIGLSFAEERSRHGIVVASSDLFPESRVLHAPSDRVDEGVRVRILRQDAARTLVVTPDGRRGWAEAHRIREI